MAEVAMLTQVKSDMGITSNAHDDKLNGLISEVTRYMKSAGLSDEKINNSVGVVSRGVSDLFYNLTDYSPYFYNALTQLKLESEVDRYDNL